MRTNWFLADAFDQDAIDTAQNTFQAQGDGFTHLIHAGYQLDLNTAAEAAALATNAQEVAQERETADEEAARAVAKAEGEEYMRPYREALTRSLAEKTPA